MLDAMHVLDCKGVAATVFGSLLGMLVRSPRLGANQNARLRNINARMLAWYCAHPGSHRLPPIFLSNLTNKDGWHDLTGPTVKAANTRAAAPFFATLAREQMTDGSPLHQTVCAVTKHLADLYGLMDNAPMFLDDAELGQMRALTVGFGIALQFLRAWAEGENLLMWQIRPKTHKAMHLPLAAAVINPKYVSNYADESQIGTTTRVWKGSVAGRYKAYVQRAVLAKRFLAQLLRYERGD